MPARGVRKGAATAAPVLCSSIPDCLASHPNTVTADGSQSPLCDCVGCELRQLRWELRDAQASVDALRLKLSAAEWCMRQVEALPALEPLTAIRRFIRRVWENRFDADPKILAELQRGYSTETEKRESV
jgi:hypothetical protein